MKHFVIIPDLMCKLVAMSVGRNNGIPGNLVKCLYDSMVTMSKTIVFYSNYLLTHNLATASFILSTLASDIPLMLHSLLRVVIWIPRIVQIPELLSFFISATFCMLKLKLLSSVVEIKNSITWESIRCIFLWVYLN